MDEVRLLFFMVDPLVSLAHASILPFSSPFLTKMIDPGAPCPSNVGNFGTYVRYVYDLFFLCSPNFWLLLHLEYLTILLF